MTEVHPDLFFVDDDESLISSPGLGTLSELEDDTEMSEMMEYTDDVIDRMGEFEISEGDLVYVRVYFMNNGWPDSVVAPMEITGVATTCEGQSVLEMIYTGDNDANKVYRGRYSFGELLEISVDSEPEIINGVEYHNFRFPTKIKLDSSLVGLGKATRACISAKFEAYMDPTIAALSETPGRITRNRAYKSIV